MKKLLAALLGEKQGGGEEHRPEGTQPGWKQMDAVKKRTRTSRGILCLSLWVDVVLCLGAQLGERGTGCILATVRLLGVVP